MSCDQTIENIKFYIQSGLNIRLIENKKNYGPGYSRNIGLINSLGKYIRFIDSDDIIPSESTKILIKYIEMYNANICRGGVKVYKNNKYLYTSCVKENVIVNINSNNSLLIKTLQGHWCYLFRKNFLLSNNIKYPINMKNAEDTVFLQNVFFSGDKIIFIKDIVYNYCIQKQNRLTSKCNFSVVKNIHKAYLHFFMICKKINRIDLFQYRFIKGFNYLYISIFIKNIKNFNIEEIKTVIKMFKIISKKALIDNKFDILSIDDKVNYKIFFDLINKEQSYIIKNITTIYLTLLNKKF